MSEILKYRGNTINNDGQETANAYSHRKALEYRTNAHGRALRKMLEGWEAFAKAERDAYSDGEDVYRLGDNYVYGESWAHIGLNIKRLLDGETGGWDCGSLAGNITELIESEGFETDGYFLTKKGGE